MSKILSGKVRKIPSTDVSDTRYNFLSLSEAEPDLGVPSQNGYFLSSDEFGTRSWIDVGSLTAYPGIRYNFIGLIGEEEEPGAGNIGIHFSEITSYFHISKISLNEENIAPIFPFMIKSTNVEKSIAVLKNIETGQDPTFFVMSVVGAQEFELFYRIYFSSSTGSVFDEGSTVSFEFSVSGDKGSAVNILGTYEDLATLELAHPIGNVGDAYLLDDGDLYVWIDAPPSWINVGPVRGPQGPPGPDPLSLDGGTSSTLFI